MRSRKPGSDEGTEKLSNLTGVFRKAFGRGATDSLAEAVIGKLGSTAVGRSALRLLAGSLGEGAEEVISGVVNPILQSLYNGRSVKENYSELDLAEVAYEGLIGAMLGTVGGMVSFPGDVSRERAKISAEKADASIDGYYETAQKQGVFSAEAGEAAKQAQEANRPQEQRSAADRVLDAAENAVKRYEGRSDEERNRAAYDAALDEVTRQASEHLDAGKTAGEQDAKTYKPGFVRSAEAAGVERGFTRRLDRLGKALSVSYVYDGSLGDGVNGMKQGNVIRLNPNANVNDGWIVGHETGHVMRTRATAEWGDLQAYLTRLDAKQTGRDMEARIQAVQALYREHGQELTVEEAREEIACDMLGDLLQDERLFDGFLRDVERGSVKPSVAQKIIDALRDILDRIRHGSAPLNAAEELGLTEQEIRRAMDKLSAVAKAAGGNENAAREGGGVKYSIAEQGGLRYVQADRQVLSGTDPDQWAKQIEGFINTQIRNGEDVLFPTEDGHMLAITERSAYKLSDRHKSQIGKQARELLSDEEFALKGRIAGHIDELIQVGTFKSTREDINGYHTNDIGEDGFNYFTAFFRDGDKDKTYYKVAFSSAKNEENETVYSIGTIRKRKPTTSNGSSGGAGAHKEGSGLSNPIIYKADGGSQGKSAMQLAFEKAMNDADDSKSSLDETREYKRELERMKRRAEYKDEAEKIKRESAQSVGSARAELRAAVRRDVESRLRTSGAPESMAEPLTRLLLEERITDAQRALLNAEPAAQSILTQYAASEPEPVVRTPPPKRLPFIQHLRSLLKALVNKNADQ